MADILQRFPPLRVILEKFQIFLFRTAVAGIEQQRRFWMPFSHLLKVVIGLCTQEVSIENMAQLMGEHTADLLIPGLAGFVPGHAGMASIDPDQSIISFGGIRFLGFPDNAHPDPPSVAVAPGLGGGDVLKVGGQGPGHKKLAVGNGFLLLCDELLDFFVIHSCQE